MSTIEIIDCEQRSEEWYQARAGCITASMFQTIMDKLKTGKNKGGYKKAAEDYAFRLAIERIAGDALRGSEFETYDMRRGRELEPEARNLHAMMYDLDIEPTGMVRTKDGKFGASADGLIGKDGGCEYKCLLSPELLKAILIDGNTEEFEAQVQGGMWLTGRTWWHFCLYCPALAPIGKDLTVIPVERDDDYIEPMEAELLEFDTLVESYRAQLLEQGATPLNAEQSAPEPTPTAVSAEGAFGG